jgi:hypothetical protein
MNRRERRGERRWGAVMVHLVRVDGEMGFKLAVAALG